MVGGQRDLIVDPGRVELREEIAEFAVETHHLQAHFAALGAEAVADIVGRRQADDQEVGAAAFAHLAHRSEEHTSELQSLMRISYAVFCLKKKNSKPLQHQKKQKSHKQNQ